MDQRFWPIFVGVLCMEVMALVQETVGEETSEDVAFQKRTAALVVATVLISLSICFEFAKEKIEHSASEEMKPVVHHLFQGQLYENDRETD